MSAHHLEAYLADGEAEHLANVGHAAEAQAFEYPVERVEETPTMALSGLDTPEKLYARYREILRMEKGLDAEKKSIQDLLKGHLEDGLKIEDESTYAMLETRAGWEYDTAKFIELFPQFIPNVMKVEGGKVTALLKAKLLSQSGVDQCRTAKPTVALVVKTREDTA